MTQQHRGLFFHGGPGSSAIPEQEKFGDSLGIDWWTQPRPTDASKEPFEELIRACEVRLLLHASKMGGKVKVYANSLGAMLVLELARRLPDVMSEITLLGPVHDAPDCYIRLGRRLAETSKQAALLLANSEALEKQSSDRERLWALVGSITASSEFLGLYWSPNAKRESEWFARLFTNPAVFDGQAFYTLLNDLLLREKQVQRSDQFTGPVTILLGKHDPLIDLQREASWWRAHFPQAELRVVDTGHFPHLELPSQHWA